MTAVSKEKNYDVAISFLVEDLTLAEALYNKLSEGFEVFFSPRRQEELAGTNGAESMRQPFLTESRLNVILFKDKWGTTPWTGVESHAIEDSAVKNQFRNVFLLVVEQSTQYPSWFPYNFMRFHLGEFSLEEAVGAIKLRVHEQGGHFIPMTPSKRAEILKSEDAYRYEKSGLNSQEGLDRINEQVKQLFNEIARHCGEINGTGSISIEHEINFQYREQVQSCILRSQSVSMIVAWIQPYSNTLERTGLFVQEFNGRRLFNSELGRLVLVREPDRVGETLYEPELARSRELGWKRKGQATEFLTSAAFAEKCVIQFVDLMERYNAGKVKQMEW
jgi:hypothetical protein